MTTLVYQQGETQLIRAAMFGHLHVVEYLFEIEADMEARDNVSAIIIDMSPA